MMNSPGVQLSEYSFIFLTHALKEATCPVQVVAARTSPDKFLRSMVSRNGRRKTAKLLRILLRSKIAAASPRFISDPPKLDIEGLPARGRPARAFVGKRCASSRRVAIFNPAQKILGGQCAEIGGEVRLG